MARKGIYTFLKMSTYSERLWRDSRNETEAIGGAEEIKLQGNRDRERALAASQTVSHANNKVGNTSMDYGISSRSGMKWNLKKSQSQSQTRASVWTERQIYWFQGRV